MRYDQTPLRMRQLLQEAGVADIKNDRESYSGRGDPWPVWNAFRTVVLDTALEPIEYYGKTVAVESCGVMFEAIKVAAGVISFTWQFTLGDAGDMAGLFLTFEFPDEAAFDGLAPDSDLADDFDRETMAAWFDETERSDAFSTPMRQPDVDYSFVIDGVG